MLERTDVITNEVLGPSTFVLAYPTLFEIFRINTGRPNVNVRTSLTLHLRHVSTHTWR